MWRRTTFATLLAGLWLVATGPAAGAHAALRGSDPTGGSSVDRAPRELTLRFSEAPDPDLSAVHVLDTTGREVSGVMSHPASGRPLELRVPLGRLGSGTYTVTWRVVSRVDGHVSQGSFAFGVGVPATAPATAAAVARAGAAADDLPAPSPLAVGARWAFYWGLALLVGAAATGLVVFDRRLPGWAGDPARGRTGDPAGGRTGDPAGGRTGDPAGGRAEDQAGGRAGGRARRLAGGRAGLLLGAGLTLAAGGLAGMSAATTADAGVPLGRLLASSTGHWLEARGAALLLAAAAVAGVLLSQRATGACLHSGGSPRQLPPEPLHRVPRRDPWVVGQHRDRAGSPCRGSPLQTGPGQTRVPAPTGHTEGAAPARSGGGGWLFALGVASGGGLLVHALASHAAAPSPVRWLNLLAQWGHLLMVGVWIGGLAWLLVGIQDRRDEMAGVVLRFSRLATWSLAVVVVTGLVRAVQELGGWQRLLSTPFGRTLDVKLGLFAALLAFGALSRFRLVPALASGSGRLGWLRRTVRGELWLAGGVLLAAALLSELPPGTDVESHAAGATAAGTGPAVALGLRASGTDYTTTVRVTLQVTPGAAGLNRFLASVADYDTGAPLAARTVRISCSLPARPEVSTADLDLVHGSDGRWHGQGAVLSISGRWSITTLVEGTSGGVTVPLQLQVAAPTVH